MKPQLEISTKKWNEEFSSGRWDYLDTNLNERARHAVIGMYCRSFGNDTAILDVGCGEGTLTDFLSDEHRKSYLGVDISEVAIRKAKHKRPGWNFITASVEEFQSNRYFNIIVCNELLYYVDFEKVIPKLLKLLLSKGMFVTSLYNTKKNHFDEPIHRYLNAHLVRIESTKIIGIVNDEEVTWTVSCYAKNA